MNISALEKTKLKSKASFNTSGSENWRPVKSNLRPSPVLARPWRRWRRLLRSRTRLCRCRCQATRLCSATRRPDSQCWNITGC